MSKEMEKGLFTVEIPDFLHHLSTLIISVDITVDFSKLFHFLTNFNVFYS